SVNYAKMEKARKFDPERRLQRQSHYMQDIWLMYCEQSEMEQWSSERRENKDPDPLMVKAAGLIQKQAFQTFQLKQVAAALSISSVRLTQKFKEEYGITPIQYLTSVRLEKAKTLLLETNLTLEQIAETIGYQNGFYVNRLFMKHMKITPSAYRKMH